MGRLRHLRSYLTLVRGQRPLLAEVAAVYQECGLAIVRRFVGRNRKRGRW